MNFLGFFPHPPPHPITFLMVRPLEIPISVQYCYNGFLGESAYKIHSGVWELSSLVAPRLLLILVSRGFASFLSLVINIFTIVSLASRK